MVNPRSIVFQRIAECVKRTRDQAGVEILSSSLPTIPETGVSSPGTPPLPPCVSALLVKLSLGSIVADV